MCRHFGHCVPNYNEDIFLRGSTGTESGAKTGPHKLEYGSTFSANNDCQAQTRLCTCFTCWPGNDSSAKKMDYPVFSISPRVIYHKLNLYTTCDAIAEFILFSSNEGDRAAPWTHHVHNTDSTDAWITVLTLNFALGMQGTLR